MLVPKKFRRARKINIYGNKNGLKANQINRLERLYRRKISPAQICSWELLKELGELSRETNRQLALLINRKGTIEYVIVGDNRSIFLPELDRARTGRDRLRGLRYIHTHLKDEKLSPDDITDLSLLRFDYISAVCIDSNGLPCKIHSAHLMPAGVNTPLVNVLEPKNFSDENSDFAKFIADLENEIERKSANLFKHKGFEKAIMVTVAKKVTPTVEESIIETRELAKTCNVEIVDSFIQNRRIPDPKYLVGKGKLKELVIKSMQLNANLLIFNQDLSPSLARRISDFTGIRLIDRTQLILDVFAQRAASGDGKIQVELAQLKYTLPRLVEKDTMMSRLTGGIGGRGPGETKLEINRRRAEDKITKLEKEIALLSKKRIQRRSQRKRANIPVVSIVGYTNAGKSTLLNNLTNSSVKAENRPFSTLDPASRRLRFPREREVVITDTVGFIKDLPKDLINAFRATLEEIGDADLILHIVDASNMNFKAHIESVEKILLDLDYHKTPRILVYNKSDKVALDLLDALNRSDNSISISALNSSTLTPLFKRMEQYLWSNKKID